MSLHLIDTIVFFLLLINSSASQSIIKNLPGFDGDLPFKLETGYIGAGKNEELQFFYYFIESEGDPKKDPLVLSITGGPGCTSLKAIVFEFGPFGFVPSTDGSGLPSVVLKPYSWTKLANFIFLDWPVGTGFSYATNQQAYYTSDSAAPKDVYDFMRNWLLKHPQFIQNRLYIEGESYAGKIVPMIALEISKANEAGLQPQMSLKGYIAGSPLTILHELANDKYLHAHNLALISDDYIKQAEISCNGEYVNIDINNIECQNAIQDMEKCLEGIELSYTLDSTACVHDRDQVFVTQDNPVVTIKLPSAKQKLSCSDEYYNIPSYWANDETVRKALHVREGTKGKWKPCNGSVAYDIDVDNTVECHLLLARKGYNGLVYSGDHDLTAPYFSVLKWIRSLNLTLDQKWRSWKIENEVGGFTTRYGENGSYLTYATIKAGGHTPSEHAPRNCFLMIARWLSDNSL